MQNHRCAAKFQSHGQRSDRFCRSSAGSGAPCICCALMSSLPTPTKTDSSDLTSKASYLANNWNGTEFGFNGIAHVILKEGLANEDYITRWTEGFSLSTSLLAGSRS